MKKNNFPFIKFLVLLEFIYFVKTSSLHPNNNNDLEGEEFSGMSTDELFSNNTLSLSAYENNIFLVEEKLKSLAEIINQLESKMEYLMNNNMDHSENKFRNLMDHIVEDKSLKIDKIIEDKLASYYISKTVYNVHELKCSNSRLPSSCYDLNECNSNLYSIMVPEINSKPFTAVCDLKTLDGGWTIIQRRKDGSENFNRNWTEYVEGFGNLNGEFFIGLEKLHALTTLGKPQELYIILKDFEGEQRYARYGEFKVDSNSTDYKLTVGKYSGNADDCFTQHSGHKFSTRDRDNDASSNLNCALRMKGAWWYSNCFTSNLNGLYLAGKISKSQRGISWCRFRGFEYSLKFVQMMIRPKIEED